MIEFTHALRTLATDAEPLGMHNPADSEERERLAVAFIRRIKEEADILPATDAAIRHYGRKWYGIGGSASARESLASAKLADEQLYNRDANREPYTFFRAKLVNVNGKTLKLKWKA